MLAQLPPGAKVSMDVMTAELLRTAVSQQAVQMKSEVIKQSTRHSAQLHGASLQSEKSLAHILAATTLHDDAPYSYNP